MAAKSVSDLRKELGAYLTKPMEIGAGNMSTQQNINATSLSTGGLDGQFLIKQKGEILVYDGSNDRVLIGTI